MDTVDELPPGAIPESQFQQGQQGAPPEVDQLPEGATLDTGNGDGSSQFESAGQEGLTALEGGARGLTAGLSDVALTGAENLGHKMGVSDDYLPSAANRAAREEANPWISKGSELGAIVGGSVLDFGAPALISGAAHAIVPAVEGAATGAKIGASVLRGAIEGGLFQGGDEISKAALGQGDPEIPVATALTHMGAAALLGGGLGGAFGTVGAGLEKLGETKAAQGVGDLLNDFGIRSSGARPAAEDIANETAQAGNMPRLKPEAPDILKAASSLDLPVMNGMVSADKAVQMGEDALIHGPPTIPAVQRQNLYSDAYNGAVGKLDEVLPDVKIEKADVGRQLQESLSSKIKTESEPFNDMYNEIRKVTPDVPLNQQSASRIAENIRNLDGVKNAFKSPAATLARDLADEVGSGRIENIEQLRQYQSELSSRLSPTASSAEKRVIAAVGDKLDSLEQNTIQRHASKFISDVEAKGLSPEDQKSIWGDQIDRLKGLQSKIDNADAQYAPFKQKISELSSWLGKGKTGGAKDATSFIQDRLEPEDLIRKLSDKRYAGLPEFMQKNFPDEYNLVRQYEKSQLRASSQVGGNFSHTKFFTNYEKLPEAFKKSIFSDAERAQLGHVNTYLGSFPKNFNPSGTSHMSAYRAFFESLKGAALGNIRDAAIKKFIVGKDIAPALEKAVGRPLNDAEIAATLKVMSSGQTTGLGQVLKHTSNAVRGMKKMDKTVESIFKGGSQQSLDEEFSEHDREKLRKYVESGAQTDQIQTSLAQTANPPQQTQSHGATQAFAKGGDVKSLPDTQAPLGTPQTMPLQNGVAQHLPDQDMLMNAAKTRINGYLNSQRPVKSTGLPFDPQHEDKSKERSYNQLLDLANKPMSIMSKVAKGNLTPLDVQHFQNMYPEIYNQLSKKLSDRVTKAQANGEVPPYKTRQALGLFLGGHLDSSMTPQTVLAAQSTYQKSQPPAQAQPPAKSSKAPLSKVAGRYQTSDQSVLSRQQKDG